jgi:regulator of nonsense transcripts 2
VPPLHDTCTESSRALDSSLKRHTALIKRIRQSIGADNHDQILKDINSLSLEKYVDEIAGAVIEGITRCKTEKDVWSAVEVRHTARLRPNIDAYVIGDFCNSSTLS